MALSLFLSISSLLHVPSRLEHSNIWFSSCTLPPFHYSSSTIHYLYVFFFMSIHIFPLVNCSRKTPWKSFPSVLFFFFFTLLLQLHSHYFSLRFRKLVCFFKTLGRFHVVNCVTMVSYTFVLSNSAIKASSLVRGGAIPLSKYS